MLLNHELSVNEQELIKKYPWAGNRRIRLPKGWFGLLENACNEIEALFSPDSPKDYIRYFFATVRDYKLHLFLECEIDDTSKAKTLAIESLIEELRSLSEYICVNCGSDIDGKNHKYHELPTCGCTKPQKHKDDQEETTVFKGLQTEIIDGQLSKVDVAIEKIDPVETISSADSEPENSIDIFNVGEVNQLLTDVQNKYRDRDDANKVRATLNKLLKIGANKIIQPIPDVLDELEQSFPNFNEVTGMLKGVQALSRDTTMLKIPPTLLLGPPGLGKTMFAQALADSMNVPFRVLRMENQQGGAGLVGSSDFWSNSKAGLVFSLLTNERCANPVIVLDEVDKTNVNAQYNPLNSLYNLLESTSAKSFNDESLPDLTLDASKITWILTANFEESIPEAILSRVRVFRIPKPDAEQARLIGKRIYSGILNESELLKAKFDHELSDEVISFLINLSPRRIKLSIETGLGRAAVAKRRNLLIEDFDQVQAQSKTVIGFIN